MNNINFTVDEPINNGYKQFYAVVEGICIGYTRYKIVKDILIIDMIRITDDNFKRKGIATKMLDSLKHRYQFKEIKPSDTYTREGKLLIENYFKEGV